MSDPKKNRQLLLRNGLTQYIGAMLENPEYDSVASKQLAVAALLEEAIKICKMEDQTIDMFTAKPILRATLYIYDCEYQNALKAAKENGFDDSMISTIKDKFGKMRKPLNSMIDAAKEPR